MRIRPMVSEDVTAVVPMENVCFTDPWTDQGFRDSLEEPSAHLLVIEDDLGQIVGYGCLYQAVDEGEIVNVAVRPDCRLRGYGAVIVRALIGEGKKLGADYFFLEVRESNVSGRALYTSLGFTECGRRKGFYTKPKEDAIMMMWQETGSQ